MKTSLCTPHKTLRLAAAGAALALMGGGAWFHSLRPASLSPEPAPEPVALAEPSAGEGVAVALPPVPLEQAVEIIAPGTELPRTAEQSWAEAAPEAELAAFQTWTGRWAAADEAERAVLSAEGVALAEKRRAVLKKLITSDPERALARTVPVAVRRALPAEVVARLETRVDATGALEALAADAAGPGERAVTHRAVIGGERYRAFVYGRRTDQPVRRGIPLHGIVLDGHMAVSEWPGRVLETVEVKEALAAMPEPPLCPVSKKPAVLDGTEVVLRVAEATEFFCGPAHASSTLRRRATLESLTPVGPGAAPIAASDGEGTPVANPSSQGNAAWTTGEKRMLVVRLGFRSANPEIYGPVQSWHDLTTQDCVDIVNQTRSTLALWSYGELNIRPVGPGGSTVTPIVVLEDEVEDYSADDISEIWDEVDDEVEDLVQDRDDYDFLLVLAGGAPLLKDNGKFPSWGGLGRIGDGYSFIRRKVGDITTQEERIEQSVRVTLHELGHNLGLLHASSRYHVPLPFTEPLNGITYSISGKEYGDIFDKMGSGSREFNPSYKHWLRWLPDSALPVAITSGSYTFREHDQVERTGRRGLSVPVNQGLLNGAHLILDHRLAGDNERLRHSVGVRLTNSVASRNRTFILDSTLETHMDLENAEGINIGTFDAPLLEGCTFSWPPTSPTVHVTNLEADPEGGLAKVQVNFGTFSGNGAPFGNLLQTPAQAYRDSEVTFTADAYDPQADDLAYFWDTADGVIHPNERELTVTFQTTGTRTVTCRVSDMKGRTTTFTKSVSVVYNATRPAFSAISDKTTPEDTMIEVPFTVSDGETPAAGIVVTGGVYDPQGVITSAGFLLGTNGGGSRWVRLTPRPNQHGAALVVLEASDGALSMSKTFKITVTPTSSGPTPVVSGSTWRYWAASAAPPAGWKNAGFADGSWSQGASPFTFGETFATGTVLPAAVPRLTTYFRRTFVGPLVFGADTPMLRVRADDGVVVYFNGTEIWRNNMRDGTPGHTTAAESSVDGSEELKWHVIPLPSLSVGAFQTHTIAAEVHDSGGRGVGDVRFDLEFQRALGPVFTSLPDRVMLEDTTLTFTVAATDAESPGDTITFTGRSLHGAVPNEGVIFDGNLCRITPKLNAAGIVTIVITASDGSTATEDSFLLHITNVNDPPVLAPLADVNNPVQQPVALIPVYISDVDHSAASLTLTATSNNQTLVPNASLSFLPDPDPANTGRRWLRFATPPGSVNDATITLTLSDGAASAVRTFVFRSIFQTPVNTTPVSILRHGSQWTYWIDGTEQPDWTSPTFDDSRWRDGVAPLGYGSLGQTTTIAATPLRVTTYFRRKFTTPADAAALGPITLKLARDDGAVVFLNGRQIHRSNMPENKDGPLILADAEQTGADQTAWRSIVLTDPLPEGENTIAVEVHQAAMPASAATSDLYFDLALEAEPAPAALVNKFILSPQLSAWRYHDGPTAPTETWAMPTYADDEWLSGPAPLGFGTGLNNTAVNGGPVGARYPVVCFRRTFDVADPAAFQSLHLMVQHDDGIRVFLNGTRLMTANVHPDADLGTFAWREIPAAEHETWRHTLHSADRLVPGTNLLAVELHQFSATGSDLHFDLELIGTAPPGMPELKLDRQPDGTWLAHWSAAYPGWNIERTSTLNGWLSQQPRAILRGARFELPEADAARQFYRLRK